MAHHAFPRILCSKCIHTLSDHTDNVVVRMNDGAKSDIVSFIRDGRIRAKREGKDYRRVSHYNIYILHHIRANKKSKRCYVFSFFSSMK